MDSMVRHPRQRFVLRLGHPATWDDLRDLPEDAIGEIVAGEVLVTPRPGGPHTHVASDLGALLAGPFRFGAGGPGGWILLDEPRIRFGEEIRVPDLAGWRRERWTGAPRTGPFTLIPDWVCEVLSPSTEADDRGEKMDLYRRAGVGHAWLMSPTARTLEIYRLTPEGWLRLGSHTGDRRVRAEPFDAVELDLGAVWSDLGPAEPAEE
jgi:Uma2 family endonuclease